MSEPADDLDLDIAVRQVDREPTRDIGVRVTTDRQIGAGVLVEPGVDLVAVSERRQVPAVGGLEPDAGRHGPAGRGVDDLDLQPAHRRRQELDRHPAEPGFRPLGRQPVRGDLVRSDGDRGIGSEREVDVPGGRGWHMAPRTPPADDRRRIVARGAGRPRGGASAEHLAQVDSHRVIHRSDDAQGPPWSERERRRRAEEGGHGGDHDATAGIEGRGGLDPEARQIGRAVRDLDDVQPQGDVPGRTRHRIADPRLRRTPAAWQDAEETRVAGCGVASRSQGRVRTPPVERPVHEVRDRGEGTLSPADDALVDLEASADDVLDDAPRGQLELVPGERLASRRDPADRQVVGPAVDGIPPGVAEMRNDDVAGPAHSVQVQLACVLDQPPTGSRSRWRESERQAAEDVIPRG